MKNIQKLSLVVLLACVGQVAKSSENEPKSTLGEIIAQKTVADGIAIAKKVQVDEATRLQVCKNINANARLANLLNNERSSCSELVNSFGTVNQALVDELLDSKKTPLSELVIETPHGQGRQDRLSRLRRIPLDENAKGTPYHIDGDEDDAYYHVECIKAQQQKYSEWLLSNRADKKLAEELEKKLSWAQGWYF